MGSESRSFLFNDASTRTSPRGNSGSARASSSTTFGCGDRFAESSRGGWGSHSPNGSKFYRANSASSVLSARGKGRCATFGIGDRPPIEGRTTQSDVGPGSYNVVGDLVFGRRRMELKGRLPTAEDMWRSKQHTIGPGLVVAAPLTHGMPRYGLERLSRGGRLKDSDDNDGPGPAAYQSALTTPKPSSAGRSGGFGGSDRFKDTSVMRCGPEGHSYYMYSGKCRLDSFANEHARSCSFGAGNKTDFGRPWKCPTTAVMTVPVPAHVCQD
mmetsp:Transcript_38955/g.70922  ORF Transcript_38955/g.70922 Transcript_38955/m.70922 type:complete len:269 (+) Transcript_38955:70-876(+)